MSQENEVMVSSVGGPGKGFVNPEGVYMGFFTSPPEDHSFYDVPSDWVEVPPPGMADQIWNFETQSWGESLNLAVERENNWRNEEMGFIADQLLRIEDGDPSALPGTDRKWRDYRIKVRAWVEGGENFPSIDHRHVRPE